MLDGKQQIDARRVAGVESNVRHFAHVNAVVLDRPIQIQPGHRFVFDRQGQLVLLDGATRGESQHTGNQHRAEQKHKTAHQR